MTAVAFVLLIVVFMAYGGLGGITSASILGQKKCVSPKAALNFIDKYGCERVYDDPKCEEQGKVEIQC